MLYWAFSFLILALIAGFLGFGGVALISVEIARMLFGIFIFLFLIVTVIHLLQGKSPPSVS
jgi:uncharacterized membrane protein YtjA (UPF0391 family)